MVPSAELSISVYFEEFGNWRQNVLLFHSFLQIFYKNFKILVLSYSLSHFVPISQKIDK